MKVKRTAGNNELFRLPAVLMDVDTRCSVIGWFPQEEGDVWAVLGKYSTCLPNVED